MPNLNSTTQKLRFKKGTADQITDAENAYGEEAEALYVTDRKQLWIHNGTEYEEVNKYTNYFYNSSGSQSGNRFNDWEALMESAGGRECRIQFEQDETIPSGAWNVSYQTWVGNGNNPDGGAPFITLPTGVTFSSSVNWWCENGLNIDSTSTSPIGHLTSPQTNFFDRTDIRSSTAPFFSVEAAGLYAIGVGNGFGLRDDGASILHIDTSAGAYATIIVVTGQGVAPVFEDDTVSGDVPIVYGWLTQSSEIFSDFGQATHSGLAGGDVDFAFGGGLFSNAKVIGFIEGQPTGIVSENVSDALAELYAGKVELVAIPSSASDTGVAGSMAYDGSYLYVCSATDTWVRTPLATW